MKEGLSCEGGRRMLESYRNRDICGRVVVVEAFLGCRGGGLENVVG